MVKNANDGSGRDAYLRKSINYANVGGCLHAGLSRSDAPAARRSASAEQVFKLVTGQ
jgi:hypothetical protein